MAEHGVEQDEAGYSSRAGDRVGDGVRARSVVPDQDGPVDAESVEHGGDFSAVLFGGEVRTVVSV